MFSTIKYNVPLWSGCPITHTHTCLCTAQATTGYIIYQYAPTASGKTIPAIDWCVLCNYYRLCSLGNISIMHTLMEDYVKTQIVRNLCNISHVYSSTEIACFDNACVTDFFSTFRDSML